MHKFTIGVEEEYQIIDVESRDLVSHVSKIIEGGKATLKENLKHEMHESVIEMETGICQNIKQAKAELTKQRQTAAQQRELPYRARLAVAARCCPYLLA